MELYSSQQLMEPINSQQHSNSQQLMEPINSQQHSNRHQLMELFNSRLIMLNSNLLMEQFSNQINLLIMLSKINSKNKILQLIYRN
jgi:hypothetical protein